LVWGTPALDPVCPHAAPPHARAGAGISALEAHRRWGFKAGSRAESADADLGVYDEDCAVSYLKMELKCVDVCLVLAGVRAARLPHCFTGI